MQMWKSTNIFDFETKGFTLKHCLIFEIYAPKVYKMFVYKHAETIEYVKK